MSANYIMSIWSYYTCTCVYVMTRRCLRCSPIKPGVELTWDYGMVTGEGGERRRVTTRRKRCYCESTGRRCKKYFR